jgi:predicted Zn finger-like uncharacterized protein
MLIVCPSCASRYSIDAQKIGAEGRTVRCANCRDDFFVTLADDLEAKEAAAPALPPSRPDRPASAEDALAAEWAMAEQVEHTPRDGDAATDQPIDQDDRDRLFAAEDAAAAQAQSGSPAADDQATDDAAGRGANPDLVLPAPAAATGWRRFLPRRRASTAGSAGKRPAGAGMARVRPSRIGEPGPASAPPRALIGLCAASSVVLVGMVWQRDAVVRLAPSSAALFQAVGMPVNLRGLVFAEVRSSLQSEGTGRFLLVEGTVASLRQTVIQVPLIEIRVRDGDGKILYAWTTDPPRSSLNPGEALHFRARLATPPQAGRDVEVRFVDRTQSASAKY